MRYYGTIAFLAIITLVPFGVGSPIDGTHGEKSDITSQPWRTARIFRGGERASVFALGTRDKDGDIIGKLHIKIFDVKGNLVVEDPGKSTMVGDFVGVAWYPPRTAEYRIEVHSEQVNKVYIAIK